MDQFYGRVFQGRYLDNVQNWRTNWFGTPGWICRISKEPMMQRPSPLTTHIETGFERNPKTVLALIDLSSAYGTVWRKGFLWKLGLELGNVIRSRKMLNLINIMLCNRMFRVYMNDRSSRMRILNDGLP